MILYRVTNLENGNFEWVSKQKDALTYGRDTAAMGFRVSVDKFDVPTVKDGLCDFLNLLNSDDDYDELKTHLGCENVKTFEPKVIAT